MFMMRLLEISVVMSLIIVFLLVFNTLFSKWHSAKSRYYIWLIVVIGLIIPFRPSFDFSLFQIPDTVIETPVTTINETTSNAIVENNVAPATVMNTTNTDVGLFENINVTNLVFIVWLVVSLSILIYQYIRYWRYQKILKRWSYEIHDRKVLAIVNQQSEYLNISGKTPQIKVCEFIQTPMLVGFMQPVILLPKMEFSEEELIMIIGHEMTHHRRKDLWVKLLVLIASAMHWFNPFVYLMIKAMDHECEESCDQEVLKKATPKDRKQYAEMILNTVTQSRKMETILSTRFSGGKEKMKKRLEGIMSNTKGKAGLAAICCLLIVAGTALSGNVFAKEQGTEVTVGNVSTKLNNPDPAITTEEANTIATEQANGGSVVRSELEYEDGILIYDVIVINNNEKHEVEINADTGAIHKYEKELIDQQSNNTTTNDSNATTSDGTQSTIPVTPQQTVTTESAQNTALDAAGGGTIVKFEYDSKDNEYEIEIIDGNFEHEIEIDGTTGAIIKHERDYED